MAVASTEQMDMRTVESLYVLIDDLRRAVEMRVPQVLSREQAAKYLGISSRKLDQLVSSKEIRNAQIGGSRRFKRVWLDEYLEANAIGGPGPSRADEILNER